MLSSYATVAAIYALVAEAENEKVKVQFDHEFRTRFERRVDRDFLSTSNDNRSDQITRYRPGVTLTGENWKSRLQLQYAHSLSWTPTRNFSTESIDATLAYVQFVQSDGTLTVGRQKVAVGDERLIGSLEWSNLGRSADGLRYQGQGWDAFGFKYGVSPNLPRNAKVLGVSRDTSAGKTTYLLKTDETPAGDVTVHTLNHIWKGKLNESSSMVVEAALQTGEVGPRDLAAYAVHFKANHKIDPKWRVGIEGNLSRALEGNSGHLA